VAGTISLRAPNIGPARDLTAAFVAGVARLASLSGDDAAALTRAAVLLVDFALEHAYLPGAEGEIAVEAHLFDGGVRIDVHDWGLPLELQRARSESASHLVSPLSLAGVDLDGLVDEVTFQNLAQDGKLFSVVKHCAHDSPVSVAAPLVSDHDDHEVVAQAEDVVVRSFEEGDEEAICRLVYRNYANTYGSEFFYIPEKLLERNLRGDVVSSVALVDGELVGHHALLREETPYAETGAAVIHPEYKGLGIYNRIAEHTLAHARDSGLPGVWCQAVTIHPYSQKAAWTHGYRATAIAVGRARASIRLEGNQLTRTGKRHAIVVDYLPFERTPRTVFLPELYRERLLATYANVGLEASERSTPASEGTGVSAELDAGLNVGTIAVSRWDEDGFARAFHYLLAKHCDMVYADLDLETVDALDAAVERLNRHGFFYSGVMLSQRDGHDQLRLQYENTVDADEDEIVCHSEFAQALRDYVLADRRRVAPD
jgi:anti-sigma regulatory factor (Ser/Thr protein kinase)/N-acetylglutamate synthase-like GNAT family acetyltransferase